MRMVKPVRVLWTWGLAAVLLLPLARVASATPQDVSIERSGSIVIFPKVIWDGQRDTIIQISSNRNDMVHAHCFYVNAAPPSPGSPPQCYETDFDIWLTHKQPTTWVASQGRSVRFMVSGDTKTVDGTVGYGLGFAPGLVPPVQEGFIGELKCVQVDAGGAPLRGNNLEGVATIRSESGDVSQYNAIAFQGNPDLGVSEGDAEDLFLDYTPSNDGGEYSACPGTLLLNHFFDGADDPVIDQLCEGAGAPCSSEPLSTELTLIPCSQNLENQLFGNVTVQFKVYNEFEVPLSASITVRCYLNVSLSDIDPVVFSAPVRGSLGGYSRITPNQGICGPNGVCSTGSAIGASCGSNSDCPSAGGVIGVAEEFRSVDFDGITGPTAAASFNLHTEGNRFDAATDGVGNPVQGVTDHIIIPQP